MKSRIMYIEDKSDSLNGPARIGRVTFSKTGRTLEYRGQKFLKVGNGYKYNHIDTETRAEYWISGPRKDGQDRLYGHPLTHDEIDADVWDEYWQTVRGRTPPRRS